MNHKVWVCVVLAAGIGACATSAAPQSGDVAPCTASLPARIVKLVYVEVTQGPGGPVITPDLCVVRSGTQVLWRTAPDALDPFALSFADPPGAGSPTQKDFASQRMGRRQEVMITAKQVSSGSEIKYEARFGLTHIDPGIKIMPQ